MAFELPMLPFEKDALMPVMSVETLEFHYGKHHRAYVEKLNQLVRGTEVEKLPLEELIRKASGPVFNNAAQVWNHTFFWNCLVPQKKAQAHPPSGALKDAFHQTFGSVEKFQTEFESAATNQFGSGWAWLVKTVQGSLAIRATSNAENPIKQGEVPLLTCDVWEHAYYIDYRNERARFVKSVWNLVNWNFVQENFRSAQIQAA